MHQAALLFGNGWRPGKHDYWTGHREFSCFNILWLSRSSQGYSPVRIERALFLTDKSCRDRLRREQPTYIAAIA